MQFELTDEEMLALLNLLVETIEVDKFPLSPRIRRYYAPPSPSSDRWPRRRRPPTGRVRPETRVLLSAAASEVR